MTNLLLYAEARRTIAQMRAGTVTGHSNPWTGDYPHEYPDDLYEGASHEDTAVSSVYDGLLEELFSRPDHHKPQLAVIG